MEKNSVVENALVKIFVEKIGGEHAQELVRICANKRAKITDEEISKSLPLKITEIRTILNRLHYRGIANYEKTRNAKTGWYDYTWSIKVKRIIELILEEQTEALRKLEKKLGFEVDHNFFECNSGCESFAFEIAAEYKFKCPQCGNPLEAQNNERHIRELKNELKRISVALNALQKQG